MDQKLLILGIICYLAAARGSLRWFTGTFREVIFALLNLAACYVFLLKTHFGFEAETLVLYVFSVAGMYVAMRLWSESEDWKSWLAFFAPLLVLVVTRYTPAPLTAGAFRLVHAAPANGPDFTLAPYLFGLSYLAFRCSYLVLEVRNGAVKKPGFWAYLGFAFFLPTMLVGPINTYANYRRGFGAEPPAIPAGRASLRVLVGLVKYLFLGSLCNQLSYSGLLLDDHYHPWIDLPIASVFYYLYLYCNFSGFCDVAIGGAGLIGITVPENFQNPFAARNVRDFWNRWHITLSHYMRDVVFSPLSKFLAHRMGPANINHAIAITIMVVFLLVGIWHGTGWNYAAFGFVHGVGVVANHYYTIALKKWLGREGFKSYNSNRWIHGAAVVLTFCYISASFFFFANSLPDMKEIFSELQ